MARDQPSPPTRPLWREYEAAVSRSTRPPRDYSAFLESLVLDLRRQIDRNARRHGQALEEAYSKGYDAGQKAAYKDQFVQQAHERMAAKEHRAAEEPDELP